jgi:transposase
MEAGTGGDSASLRHDTGHRRGCSTLRNIDHRGGHVMTTLLPPNVKVHLALGYIDMRKGIDGLAMLVQEMLRQDPFTGHLFVFRGRTRANLIKIVFWDGTGLCPFTKRLEHGVFLWPPSVTPGETLSLTSTQLSSLLDGVDWRAPEQRWRPAVAG